jgi:hypothetical protein
MLARACGVMTAGLAGLRSDANLEPSGWSAGFGPSGLDAGFNAPGIDSPIAGLWAAGIPVEHTAGAR